MRPSLEAIIARFRLAPPQACDNLFILDFIARRSAKKAVDAEGKPGWSLSFDPHFWERFGRLDPVALVKEVRVPLALIRGAKSQLFQARRRRLAPEPHCAWLALCRDPGSGAPRDDRPAARLCRGAANAARSLASGEGGVAAQLGAARSAPIVTTITSRNAGGAIALGDFSCISMQAV